MLFDDATASISVRQTCKQNAARLALPLPEQALALRKAAAVRQALLPAL